MKANANALDGAAGAIGPRRTRTQRAPGEGSKLSATSAGTRDGAAAIARMIA